MSQTQFDSCEQLKSAFAAYEENQLQKLKDDNVLGNELIIRFVVLRFLHISQPNVLKIGSSI